MTTIDDRLRRDLPSIAETIDTHPRPWQPRRVVSRRGRRAVVGGVTVLALAGGGIAFARVLIPDDVEQVHHRIDDFGGCGIVDSEQTRLVATAVRADGDRLELWIAPTTSGLVADSVRIVDARDGSWVGTGGGCGNKLDESWAGASTELADGESTGIVDVRGHIAEPVSAAIVTFASGATVNVKVQSDGYFLTSFRDDVTKYETLATVSPAS